MGAPAAPPRAHQAAAWSASAAWRAGRGVKVAAAGSGDPTAAAATARPLTPDWRPALMRRAIATALARAAAASPGAAPPSAWRALAAAADGGAPPGDRPRGRGRPRNVADGGVAGAPRQAAADRGAAAGARHAPPAAPASERLRLKKEYRKAHKGADVPPDRAAADVPRPVAPTPLPPPRIKPRLAADPTDPRRADVGAWFPLDLERLPEVGADAAGGVGAYSGLPRGGLVGLPLLQRAAGGRLLHRACLADVLDAVRAAGGDDGAEHAASDAPRAARLLLAGPPGSGKSLTLAATVAWARAAGWVAVYVPSPARLIDGGTFAWNDAAAGWNTPLPARGVLTSLMAAHGDALAGVAVPGAKARTAADVAAAALAAGPDAPPADAVDAALTVLAALRATTATRVLFAVDAVATLHGASRFRERSGARGATPIPAGDLRLARALRLLDADAPPARGVDVCATAPPPGRGAAAAAASPRLGAHPATIIRVPRFDRTEWDALLVGWAAASATAGAPAGPALPAPGSDDGDRAFWLTGGAPRDAEALLGAIL